jgi:hypothetical protein
MMILTTEAGTEIELAEDCCGWYATHDGITYHLTATCTSTAKTPAKWCAR